MDFNMMKTFKLCVETCMGIKEGERVLIVTNDLNMDIAEGLAIISYMKNADPYILSHTSLKRFDVEPPELISDCMKKADVVLIALPFFEGANFFHTQARKDLIKRGARFAMVWITPEIAKITKEEIFKTKAFSEKMAEILTLAKKARIRTEAGTDITMNIEGRNSVMISSILDKPGDSGTIPDFAEAAIAPIEGSAEGIVVIDGSMAGFENLIIDPIIWRVEKGRVVEITGKEEAFNLKQLLKDKDENSVNIAELGIGVIDRCKISGGPDDKKILGTGHIAIGDNRFGGGNISSAVHLDAVFKNMTLELDGKLIMENGILKI